MPRVTQCVLLGALLFGFTGQVVEAEPILVTSGFVTKIGVGASTTQVELSGAEGFSLTGHLDPTNEWGPFFVCGVYCEPGSSLNLGSSFPASDLGATATLRGETFRLGGVSEENAFLQLFLDSEPVTVPAVSGNTAVLSAPLALFGIFFFPQSPPSAIRPNEEVFGTGIATVFLSSDVETELPGWRVTRVEYHIGETAAPVPEPTSLLLLGGGLSALYARRRVRASHKRV